MVAANGNAPAKISASVTVGSLIALLITKQEMPSGGVNSPLTKSALDTSGLV